MTTKYESKGRLIFVLTGILFLQVLFLINRVKDYFNLILFIFCIIELSLFAIGVFLRHFKIGKREYFTKRDMLLYRVIFLLLILNLIFSIINLVKL